MKGKWRFIKKWLFILYFIASIGIILYFTYQNYRMGNVEDREELLAAVIFDLYEVQSLTKEDVRDIEVFRSDAGIYPYFYNVLVTLENGSALSYTWGSPEKDYFDIDVYPK
ncbi:hypothetical protein [Metasolibacillus sp.]|uniref:hypothetical protein n=1 Tax=Metasolibacillus sp. TaxID=2703680 RepID=UPI0025DE5782|nr:hypothetical protein [Metasolibacillus sp.]MCT6926062.1 hypothetical protein [Metasolibacillus sp.]MCT6942218.1 hypothetical protein [Metasolibacillus sp.]